MAPMVTNSDSGNIGANGVNDYPLEKMMIHWSYNGGNVDNNACGDNGSNPMATMVSMVKIIRLKTLAPMASLAPVSHVGTITH